MRKGEQLRTILEEPTLTVPKAAEILGLSRNGAYDAARRGELPTLIFGKRILVPTSALRRMLGIDAPQSTEK